jgi:undecaprenyl-diphosphatase
MSIFEALILGVVQGITEFLPISSSGHLIFIPELFGWAPHGLDFDVLLHVATLCSILWVLREDVLLILKGLIHKENKKGVLGWKILLGTVPLVFIGLAISSQLFDAMRSVEIVAIMLIVWGVFLWAADIYAAKQKKRLETVEGVSWHQALMIGIFQVFALIPGTSRSGATMTGGLFFGLDRKVAARFSFLLAIPAIAGAGLLTLLDAAQNGFETEFLPMFVGFVASFLSGALAIKFLLAFLQKSDFKWFAGYRIALGIILLVFFVA